MISILLNILKILGILLLILLAIILTVLILILFVPVRYSVTAKRKVEEEKPIQAKVKITWLLHILNMRFLYPDAAYLRVRVFCFTIFRSDKKQEPEKAKSTGESSSEKAKESSEESPKESLKEAIEEEQRNPQIKETNAVEDDTHQTLEEIEKTEVPPTWKGFFKKLIHIIRNIKYTILKIYDKIKHILENIEYYLKVIRSEAFQSAFGVCSSQLAVLLISIRPRKISGDLLIGTGDPAGTGQILAIYGMLYPVIGNHISITPDFERQIIEGNLFVKGRITVIRLIQVAWKVYFHKDIRRVIRLLKREAA